MTLEPEKQNEQDAPHGAPVHRTAIVSAKATVGKDCRIGPYAIIEDHVVLGDNCRVGPHVQICGHTSIGEGTVIHAGAIIGDEPQHLAYDGSVTYTEIGARCTIREYVTVHRGAEPDSKTIVGDDVMLMGFVHIAHNCCIGNRVIIANQSVLGGHVKVEDRAFISGMVGIHQFVRIGTLAIIGGFNRILQDVPPYCLVQDGTIRGMNTIGLRRAGISQATRTEVRTAIKTYFFQGLNRPNALAAIRERSADLAEIQHFTAFIESTKRGILNACGQEADDDSEKAKGKSAQ